MTRLQKLLSVSAVLLLAACSGGMPGFSTIKVGSELEALNGAQAIGSPFTKHLTEEYRAYANQEFDEYDHADSLHFARKGLATAAGETVMPEVLDDWDLDRPHITEMSSARAQLVDVLENGGRDIAAQLAAVAQARFDCWVEEQEEDWQTQVTHCRNEFYNALRELQTLVEPEPYVEPAPAPVTVAEEPVRTPVPLEQALFLVFFDWDKSDLTGGANDVIDAIVKEVMSRDDVNKIKINGHTDSSGGDRYNDKLSKKRAEAVRDALVARGIDPTMVVVEASGEKDLLVKTADNVREPANRRAQISLE